jgi:hypothetical protein
MSQLTDLCGEILTGSMNVPSQEASTHPFTLFAAELERKAKIARLAYPFVYLAIGIAFLLSLAYFSSTQPDSWSKLVGAILAVFSALMTFWKPDVELKQSDCRTLLQGKRLAGSDLQEINKLLSVPSKTFENVVKLLGALASFVAVYLLLEV